MGELSAPLRETIVAVDVAGLSYREAADALGTRTGTIMSRLFAPGSGSPRLWRSHERRALRPRSRAARGAGLEHLAPGGRERTRAAVTGLLDRGSRRMA